jgi:hypothetical protein
MASRAGFQTSTWSKGYVDSYFGPMGLHLPARQGLPGQGKGSENHGPKKRHRKWH